MANIVITDRIRSSSRTANIDAKYGPYASVEAANRALGEQGDDVISVGLTVGITQRDGSVKEYWYQPVSGVLTLVEKQVGEDGSAYHKPDGGIPYNDLSTSVQQSLGNADTAYQKPSAGIPASDIAQGVIPDVSGFVTRSVNDLTNYYLKSETYTKAEVAELIAAINQFHYEIHTSLPSSGENNVLYLIGPTGTGADKYEEYVYNDGVFTKIGDTSIDLSNYVTTNALNTALANYVTSANFAIALSGKENSSNKVTSISQSSTDTEYPSAHAVVEYVSNHVPDVMELTTETINTLWDEA